MTKITFAYPKIQSHWLGGPTRENWQSGASERDGDGEEEDLGSDQALALKLQDVG